MTRRTLVRRLFGISIGLLTLYTVSRVTVGDPVGFVLAPVVVLMLVGILVALASRRSLS